MLTRKKFAEIFPPTTSPAAAFTSRFTFKPSLISSVCQARTRWRGLSDDIAGREGWSGTRVVGRGRVGAGETGERRQGRPNDGARGVTRPTRWPM